MSQKGQPTKQNKAVPSVDKSDLVGQEEEEAEHTYMSNLLSKRINWDEYANSKLLLPKEAGMLNDFGQNTPEGRQQALADRGQEYASVFVKVIASVQNKEPRQYLLSVMDIILENDPSAAHLFQGLLARNINPYTPLLSIVRRDSEELYTVGKASHILSILLRGQGRVAGRELDEFLNWLLTGVNNAKGRKLQHVVTALKNILKDVEVREKFVRIDNALTSVVGVTRDLSNTQVLYLAAYCIWLLSFRKELLGALHEAQVVGALADLVKNVTREKVIRVCLSTFVNLLDQLHFNEEMVGAGLHKLCETLSARKWKDEDIPKDLGKLDSKLEETRQQLSSFEMYKAEVVAGNLRWSPVHNEQFWRENINKFEDDNFELIGRLVNILKQSDNETAEVACYDLGEFARFHPDGKRLIAQLRAKPLLMAKMSSPNPKIARQALLAVQKIMVSNWESLQNSGGVAAISAAGSGGKK